MKCFAKEIQYERNVPISKSLRNRSIEHEALQWNLWQQFGFMVIKELFLHLSLILCFEILMVNRFGSTLTDDKIQKHILSGVNYKYGNLTIQIDFCFSRTFSEPRSYFWPSLGLELALAYMLVGASDHSAIQPIMC